MSSWADAIKSLFLYSTADSIKVSDGGNLSTFCGDTKPEDIEATGNELTIEFTNFAAPIVRSFPTPHSTKLPISDLQMLYKDDFKGVMMHKNDLREKTLNNSSILSSRQLCSHCFHIVFSIIEPPESSTSIPTPLSLSPLLGTAGVATVLTGKDPIKCVKMLFYCKNLISTRMLKNLSHFNFLNHVR